MTNVFCWQNSIKFALLHSVLQGQICLLLLVFLDFLLLQFPKMKMKRTNTMKIVLVLEGVVGLHRTSQLQLLRHQWLEHRLVLL